MGFRIVDKRPGGGKGTISIGLAGEATEVWEVIADRDDYSTEDVRGSGIFPPVYQSYHLQNPRLLLMPIEIEQDDECPARFICTLKWTSEPLSPDKEQEQDDPLDRKARIKIKTVRETEHKHRDKYGKAKVNSAGDLFENPLESPLAHLQIILRKNVTAFPDWIFDYIDCVNTTDFVFKGRTIKAKTCCVWDIELGEEQEDGSVTYAEAVVEFHVKKFRLPAPGENAADIPGPWDTEQLDEGLHQLVFDPPNSGTLVRKRIFVDTDDEEQSRKQPAANPVLLNGAGEVLDPITIDNAHFNVFRDHEYRDFAPIAFLWSNA